MRKVIKYYKLMALFHLFHPLHMAYYTEGRLNSPLEAGGFVIGRSGAGGCGGNRSSLQSETSRSGSFNQPLSQEKRILQQ